LAIDAVPPTESHRTGGFVQRLAWRHWVATVALATLCVALTSGATPWIQALGGAFSPPDLAADVAAAQLLAGGSHPYTADFAARQAGILNIPAHEGYPYFPHPPFAVALMWPFAGLAFNVIAAAWFALSLGLLFVLGTVLAEIATTSDESGSSAGPRTAPAVLAFGLLLLWPPVLYNLEKGQFSILLAVLIALAWRALTRGRDSRAGIYLGAAAAIKTFPLVLGGYLLTRAPRALKWLIVVAGMTTFAMLVWMGPRALPAFVRHSAENITFWQTWPAVTYSVHGAAARVFIGGQWATPLMHSPALARTVELVAILVLIGCALRSSVRPHQDEGTRFAAWTTLLVVLNPVSMGHNGVLLALPAVLTARPSLRGCRTWPKLAWAIAIVLVSIPRQTLLWMAPAPLDPWQSVFITALPMWGALLLFAAAVARPSLAPHPLG